MGDRLHASLLLAMADKDLTALGGMSDRTVFADEVFGFHAQQATEKALKAWLAVIGADYPKTHDLRLILALLERSGAEVGPFWSLVRLDVFAVQFRYTVYEEPEHSLDREATRAEVSSLLDHVRPLLQGG